MGRSSVCIFCTSSLEGLILSAKALILVAPTVIAIATVSFNSSFGMFNSFATAKQYEVQGSQPAAKEAASAIRCFVLRSKV